MKHKCEEIKELERKGRYDLMYREVNVSTMKRRAGKECG